MGGIEIFFFKIRGSLFSIIAVSICLKRRNRALGHVAFQILQHRINLRSQMIINQFTGFIDREDIKQVIFHRRHGAYRPEAFSRRHIHEGNRQEVIFFCQAGNIIILFGSYGMFQRNRPRRDDLDDFPLDNALGQLRVFHLFANGYFISFMDQPFYISIRRMERHTAHGHPFFIAAGPPRQSQIQLP